MLSGIKNSALAVVFRVLFAIPFLYSGIRGYFLVVRKFQQSKALSEQPKRAKTLFTPKRFQFVPLIAVIVLALILFILMNLYIQRFNIRKFETTGFGSIPMLVASDDSLYYCSVDFRNLGKVQITKMNSSGIKSIELYDDNRPSLITSEFYEYKDFIYFKILQYPFSKNSQLKVFKISPELTIADEFESSGVPYKHYTEFTRNTLKITWSGEDDFFEKMIDLEDGVSFDKKVDLKPEWKRVPENFYYWTVTVDPEGTPQNLPISSISTQYRLMEGGGTYCILEFSQAVPVGTVRIATSIITDAAGNTAAGPLTPVDVTILADHGCTVDETTLIQNNGIISFSAGAVTFPASPWDSDEFLALILPAGTAAVFDSVLAIAQVSAVDGSIGTAVESSSGTPFQFTPGSYDIYLYGGVPQLAPSVNFDYRTSESFSTFIVN